MAYSGRKSADTLAAIAAVDAQYSSEVICKYALLIGSNDVVDDTLAADDIETNIASIVGGRQAAGYHCYVGTIMKRYDCTGVRETKRLAVNAWIRSNCNYFDFANLPELSDPANTTYYADAPNGIHPTVAGMAVMAVAAKPSLQ